MVKAREMISGSLAGIVCLIASAATDTSFWAFFAAAITVHFIHEIARAIAPDPERVRA